MSAINFVVRDVAGNISRGSVAGEGVPSSLIVGTGADVSLNLTRGQIVSYTRQGQALEITLIDGRTIVIEGFFTTGGVSENQLYLSSDGFLVEVELTQGAGADYFANYVDGGGVGKFAQSDELYFMRSSDVMLADTFTGADDQVGMLGALIGGLGPVVGVGAGVAAVVGATALVAGGGDGGGGAGAPEVTVTSGTTGADGHVVNETDHADGIEIAGTGTPGATVEVTIGGVTETTTIGDDGLWDITFEPDDIESGEYEVAVVVTGTDGGGTTTITDTLIVDTVSVGDISTPGGADGVINADELAAGVTLSGTVTGGEVVVVTINGVDYPATVTGTGWTLDLDDGVLPGGEYTQDVTITVTDTAGNSSTTTSTIVVDTVTTATIDTTSVGGADNVVNGVEHNDGVTLTGTAQPGATVVVTVGGVSQTVTAAVDGTWTTTFTSADIPTGEVEVPVSVTATDTAGNSTTTDSSFTVDTITNVSVDTAIVGGADNVVNATEHDGGVTLTGTAQPGATIVVTLGTVTQTVTAGGDGTWTTTYSASDVPTGELEVPVNVTATDGAGNSVSTSSTINVDTLVNELVMTSNSAGGGDGVVNLDETGQTITMAGTVEVGSSVSVNLHGVVMNATVDADGNWSVTFPGGTLPAGEYDTSVTVTATDAAGNMSSLSEPVTVDTVVGEVALSTQPIEIDDVVNDVEHADGVIISGTATAGMTVTVGLGAETLNVVAGADGSWSVNFPAGMVPEGTYESAITASITDTAGNFQQVSDSVQIDTEVVPFNFSATPIEGDNVISAAEGADGVTITGQVEANSSVTIEFNGESVTVLTGADGAWSADFSGGASFAAGEYNSAYSATATDPAGNVSVINGQVLVDNIVSTLTATDPVEGDNILNFDEASDGLTLSGTVEAGSSVMVTFEGIMRAATVDASGNWTVDFTAAEIPGGEYDTTVMISATDAYGNTDSITDEFRVDTLAPTVPSVETVTTNSDDKVEFVGLETSGNSIAISEVTEAGTINHLADETDGVALPWGDTLFNFDPALPDGSHLVISETDVAGNYNATYVALEEAGTSVIDISDLGDFDIGSIDLSFAKDSELTLDLSTIEGLSDLNNVLFVKGGADDFVNIAGATDTGTSATFDGKAYDLYTMGADAEIYIEQDIVNVTI